MSSVVVMSACPKTDCTTFIFRPLSHIRVANVCLSTWQLKSGSSTRWHAYEYTVRQDILFAMEYMELHPERCEALLKSKDIIGDVLSDFNKIETGYMDIIRDCIEGRADKMIRLEAQREEAR